ncbi:PROTEIN KINASE putative-RELATED [Salix viminalis]|uniref:PROTEIN KINASE putative-RELATED n=1 Tax=Salix viminalis TaxID=40686 RepID=A0A9Q0NYP5_SALVM|nr:PROTEIN KINASE putative-RELATED [Salix viminalis]
MPLSSSLLRFLLLLLLLATLTASQLEQTTYLLPLDAVSILSFKSKADLDNKLFYTLNERFDYCQWQGIKCAQGRVVRVVLQGFGLRGTFPPSTLSRLDQLRVLSLQNNSLSGPIPDLSPLFNLKSLFLNHNSFSASFPPSILLLHRLTILDLSYNNLSGQLPVNLSSLDRLNSLQLEFNQFDGTLPSLDLGLLVYFNVSGNNLTGPIPLTPTLSRFDTSSFSLNPYLCGEIINKGCNPRSPFFDSSATPTASSPAGVPFGQSAQAGGGVVVSITPPSKQKHSRSGVVWGFIVGVSVLVLSLLCIVLVLFKKQKQERHAEGEKEQVVTGTTSPARTPSDNPAIQSRVGEKGHEIINTKAKEGTGSTEQLMRASAELLGRGTIGTTYKAVLDNQLIVTVKRLDASKTAITSSDVFERHMDVVGELRHQNLVPIAAFFQAKGERLVIFDYQPNGSLFNLIHGSRSTRAKPLHWTSCLKIAEDVARGLAYIHQTSNLVHGNLKSANVLLGADFEACITDYCLAMLADTSSSENPDSAACKAPETRKAHRPASSKSDVYAFGVLLLELLTGKHPSQHPYLVPADMLDWVRTVRDDGSGDDNQLGMLTEVASVCSLTSPEQRPAMWQVLKMIQEIKDSVMVEENAAVGYS